MCVRGGVPRAASPLCTGGHATVESGVTIAGAGAAFQRGTPSRGRASELDVKQGHDATRICPTWLLYTWLARLLYTRSCQQGTLLKHSYTTPYVCEGERRERGGCPYFTYYLSHYLAAISMAAVYTDAAHIADGVIGLKQRSLAASDPTERAPDDAHPVARSARLRRPSSVGVSVCV